MLNYQRVHIGFTVTYIMGFNYRVYGDSLHDSTESASTAAELW